MGQANSPAGIQFITSAGFNELSPGMSGVVCRSVGLLYESVSAEFYQPSAIEKVPQKDSVKLPIIRHLRLLSSGFCSRVHCWHA